MLRIVQSRFFFFKQEQQDYFNWHRMGSVLIAKLITEMPMVASPIFCSISLSTMTSCISSMRQYYVRMVAYSLFTSVRCSESSSYGWMTRIIPIWKICRAKQTKICANGYLYSERMIIASKRRLAYDQSMNMTICLREFLLPVWLREVAKPPNFSFSFASFFDYFLSYFNLAL